jgi:Glycosyltransferase
MKFALISHVMPPSGSGQSVMLARLLGGLDPAEYCLISAGTPVAGDAFARSLPARYYQLPHQIFVNRGFRYGLKFVREAINFLLGVRARARRIREIVQREKCSAIVACSGDLEDLPAAWLASRRLSIPFYAYYFDYYSHQFVAPEKRVLARLVEPLFIRRTAGIITTNEILTEDLRRRYGVDSTVLHLPCDLEEYERLASDCAGNEGRSPNEVSMVYTGAIYDAHFNAFRNLLRAIETLKGKEIKVHIYAAQDKAELAANGIAGPVILHNHRPNSEMPCVQRRADILFLALAFNSPYPVIVRTAAPSKLAEYLASGRPILCHAPRDSFISWYFRKYECGVVVDEDDPAQLAKGIELILGDAQLCQRMIANAYERARTDFSISASRAAFAQLLSLNGVGR